MNHREKFYSRFRHAKMSSFTLKVILESAHQKIEAILFNSTVIIKRNFVNKKS